MRRTMSAGGVGNWLRYDGIPVVKSLIVANIVTLVLVGLLRMDLLGALLAFTTRTAVAMPWTLFTYPLLTQDPLQMLFAGYWLWVAGGSLERTWGSRTFAIFFFVVSAVTALGLLAGSLLTGIAVPVTGLWLPLAGVTIAFAMQNPEQQILFMLIIPLKLKYLALIDVVLVFFSYGSGGLNHLPMGALALAGCALAYWYTIYGRHMSSQSSRRYDGDIIRIHDRLPQAPRRNLNPIKWYRDRQQRKRLKDLFDRSGYDDTKYQ